MLPMSYALPDVFSLQFITQVSKYEEGMPVYFQLFATHSLLSVKALTILHTLYTEYPNVFVAAVSYDSSDVVRNVIKSHSALKQINICIDKHSQVKAFAKSRGITGIPTAFVFDGNGSIAWEGYPTGSRLHGVLRKLNQIPVQVPCLSTSTIQPPKFFNPEMTNSRKDWRLPNGGVKTGEIDPKALIKSTRHVRQSEEARVRRSKRP
ncbi:Hypothetical protein GLP15_457 [Giardia lamblia P15]|uniref:Thioredoxin-like fold domain-containing protein n=1 Tax=Giardia intestinalis (strain P15) TaxID=658858 RepID=E1F093_GIAIA|nr:Hypothetical protein GLP15_457 [Giardia lamblia P15]